MARSNYAATGTNLLWLALTFEGLGVVLEWIQLTPRSASIPIFGILIFLFWWFLTAQVAAGRDWARIVYLVLVALEVLGLVGISLVPIPATASLLVSPSGVASLLALARIILQAVGIIILFMAHRR